MPSHSQASIQHRKPEEVRSLAPTQSPRKRALKKQLQKKSSNIEIKVVPNIFQT
jgi:hypothetical protein